MVKNSYLYDIKWSFKVKVWLENVMAWKQSLVMVDTWITDILAKHIFIIEKEGYYYLLVA